MCRWLAYLGSPVLLEDLLSEPGHSLLAQSANPTFRAEPANGDGFGVGWVGGQPTPGVFRSVEPAWNDRNLREVSAHITSGCIFAHVRASTGSPVQLTNCHPFRHRRWMFMHNGLIHGFRALKRDLAMAVDPELYPDIEGSTDTEVLFNLALTYGLEHDPPAAVARAVGVVEEVAQRHGIPFPMLGTIATTDGRTLYAFRYSTEGRSPSMFHSSDVATLRTQYPDNPLLGRISADACLVVSEPLGAMRGAWQEVPESTCVVIGQGRQELRRFSPRSSSPRGEAV
jgi:predicted glutamine amidotransferase